MTPERIAALLAVTSVSAEPLSGSSTKLLYGTGSNAWSLTATPTYQDGRFFVRGELAYVRAEDATSGSTFGDNGTQRDQVRVLAEAGVLF